MTQASEMLDAGLRGLLVHAGATVTYTEAGAGGQSATALEIRTRVRGDSVYRDFVFRSGQLTVSDTAWRGATVTGSDSKVYRIDERHDAPGIIVFSAGRALERS